jgi:hypothetical protein
LDSVWSARSILLEQGAAWSEVIARDDAIYPGQNLDKDLRRLDDAQQVDHSASDREES